MSNKVLEKFDEINEKKKLSLEEKDIIRKKIFDNLIIATDVIAIFTILIVSSLFLEKQILKNIYEITSMVMLMFTIFIWELAYKKDDGLLAICGIEMLIVSICILFMPYSLLKLHAAPLKFINIVFIIYYCIKNFIIYHKEKTKLLKQNSDIKEIVKKESEDAKAEENIQHIKEKIMKKKKQSKESSEVESKETPKSKRKTTTKKTNNTKKTTNTKKQTKEVTTTKTTKRKTTKKSVEKEPKETKVSKKATNVEEKVVPKKRGRPRKETVKQ